MAEDISVWADKLQHMEVTEIHGAMVDLGIKGIPGQAARCALSDFLLQKTGERFRVTLSVEAELQEVTATAAPHPNYRNESHDLGFNAARFATMFDQGKFPEIMEWR